MGLQEKIWVTFIWVIGAFILIYGMRSINNQLKSRLLKSNPKLVKEAPWFFSETKRQVVDYLIIGLTIVWILMIWLGKVESFL